MKRVEAMELAGSQLSLLVRVFLVQSLRKLVSLKDRSRLLTCLIFFFMAGYAYLAFWLFYRGLHFVGRFPALGLMMTERLMFLLFASLFLLLLLSNLVISYTNFFRNRETQYLLSLPLSAHTVFQWKLMESAVLASWAFLFLIAPLLTAYGLNQNAAWDFYALTCFLVVLFIVLPSVFGCWCSLVLARYLDRKTFQIVGLVAVGALIAVARAWLTPEQVTDELLETRVMEVLDRLLKRTEFSQFPFLPSYWLSSGVLHWADGARPSSIFFTLVLLSHVLFWGYLSLTRSGGVFYEAFSAVQSRGSVLGRWSWFRSWQERHNDFQYPVGVVERFFACIPNLPVDVRAVLVKDTRMFWRDTTQWGQTIMLFGLLGVYILNLGHFSRQLTNPFWVHLVSFLNLGACSLNLATLTTRFVFPQFSLEGKRVWIVGMAPIGLVKVVRTKFWLATTASLAITAGLIFISCHMLKLSMDRTLFFVGAVACMSLTLNGLAMGLGTLYPNLKEENPSKIVSGFGGTFCLVLSFLYIVLSVVLLAVGSPWSKGDAHSTQRLWMGLSGFIVISWILGWIPLKLAFRRLKDLEV